MKPYYPIPYSINETWLAIHVWHHLIVIYSGREGNIGKLTDVFPLVYQGRVAWENGEIKVLEGDETAMPLDAIRTIFEKQDQQIV